MLPTSKPVRTKVLVTVKTYPTLSVKYNELVCTAGLREDGSWVRIYPIPFRHLEYDSQYSKYQWIELDLIRNISDPRPESFNPVDHDNITLGQKIGTDKGLWLERRDLILKNVRGNMSDLIADAKDRKKVTSLAVFKPSAITDFIIEPSSPDWDSRKLDALDQGNLFQKSENPFKVVRKLPFKFSYVFVDETGKQSTLMIEDWEIGQLYWNCLSRKFSPEAACADVRKKYFDDFAVKKDLHFFLGTTREHHFRAKNPFIIIGVFYPKKTSELLSL